MARSRIVPSADPQINGTAGDFAFGANAGQDVPQPAETAAPAKPAGLFSRESLRLGQNYGAALGSKDHTHIIPVDKPSSSVWFRVNPDPDFVFDCFLLQVKDGPDRGTYQVASTLLPLLAGEPLLKPFRLVLTIDRQGELRLWPLRLPVVDGRVDDWMDSALAICEQAKTAWTRLVAGANGYKSMTSTAILSEPSWPAKTFDELLDTAFKKRRIASEDEPVLRRLRGGA